MKRTKTMSPWLKEPETSMPKIRASMRNMGAPGRINN
jgi:hypothetical protein